MMDSRITNDCKLSFQFCLRLPQHTYDDATGVMTLIVNSSPTPTSSTTARSLTSCFAATSSGTPSSGTPTKGTSITSTNGTSPAMTRFLSAQKSNGGTKKGYYGDPTFLDNMTEFQLTFGISPFMLPSSPTKTSTDMSCQKISRDYGELCKLEIFMHLCMLNYVGHTKVDVGLNTLDICSQISDVSKFITRTDECIMILLTSYLIDSRHWRLVCQSKHRGGWYSYAHVTFLHYRRIYQSILHQQNRLLLCQI